MVALMTDKLTDVLDNLKENDNMLLSPQKAKKQDPKFVSSPNEIAKWIATYFRCWAGGEEDETESIPALAKASDLKIGKQVMITYKETVVEATIKKRKGGKKAKKWVCTVKYAQGIKAGVTRPEGEIFDADPTKTVDRAPGCRSIKRFANHAPKAKLEEAGIAQALRKLGKHLSKMSSVSPAERTPAAKALLDDLKDEKIFPKKWGEYDNVDSSAGDDGKDDAANDDGKDEVTDDDDDGEGGDEVAETKTASDTDTSSSSLSNKVLQFKVSIMRSWTCACSVRRSRSYTTYVHLLCYLITVRKEF